MAHMQRGDTLAQLPKPDASIFKLSLWRQNRLQFGSAFFALVAIGGELLAGRGTFFQPVNRIIRLCRGLRGSKEHQCCCQSGNDPFVSHLYPSLRRSFASGSRVASTSERAGLPLRIGCANAALTPFSRPPLQTQFRGLRGPVLPQCVTPAHASSFAARQT